MSIHTTDQKIRTSYIFTFNIEEIMIIDGDNMTNIIFLLPSFKNVLSISIQM